MQIRVVAGVVSCIFMQFAFPANVSAAPLPALKPDIDACALGQTAACENVDRQLSAHCAADPTAAAADQEQQYCVDNRLSAQQVAKAAGRVASECGGNSGSIACTQARYALSEAEARFRHVSLAEFDNRIFVNPQASTSPIQILFIWNQDQSAGNCTTLSGARLLLSKEGDGYGLRYTAQMRTSFSISGDIWHVTWIFFDAAGHEVLRSRRVEFQDDNSRLRPQDSIRNVDYSTHIGPELSPERVDQILHSIKSVSPASEC
jgi:hypothetical protein